MARRDLLPTGGTLSNEVFARRHRTLRILLVLHVPALALLGSAHGQSGSDILIAVLPVLAAAVASGFGRRTRRSLLVAVGLAYCSAATIGLANGAVEAHYHVLVMVGFVALYQDWVPFIGLVSLAGVGYLAAAETAPTDLFDAPANQRPLLWAAVHVGFVLAEAVAMVVFWRATEHEQNRATALASSLTKAELARTREASEMRQSSSDLLTNLARRNQILLDRQLERIDALEQVEKDPEALAELFSLDHLATRMRRNAESLLVLAGSVESRAWSIPIPLSEICRGAMAEVEDYARVDVALMSEVLVDGEAVGDIVHLVAELIENATSFSPPTSRVLVSGSATSSGYVLAVSDAGIGMADADLHAANATLAGQESAQIEAGGMLGLHVVARLASRYDMRVWLQRGQDSGLSALVSLPNALLAQGETPTEGYGEPSRLPELPVVSAATVSVEQPQPSSAFTEPAFVEPQVAPAVSPFVEPVLPSLEAAPQPAFAMAEPVSPPVAEPASPRVPQQSAPLGADQPPAFPAALPAAPLTAAGLQRRVPRASLAAPLATAPVDSGPTTAAETPIEPERARSVLGAFVGGAHRARQVADAIDAESAATSAGSGDQA